ncbi:MAG: hypothetical protein QOH49_1883 [Acidobacteriota bacterium]|jgi:DUF4097 and DUF4098 domain-containing protein YvlB|nr:hypothetical protein [Acidobacteriota bacterium]
MSKKHLLLSLAALLALVLTAADASQAQRSERPELTEEFHQTYTLAAGGRVSLSNINGAVKVQTWERAEVKVDAVKRAYTAERLREAQIKVDASSNRVRIETEYPDSTLRWSDRDGERHENPANVEYTLTVPRGVNIDEINLINGNLSIAGVAGPVKASSINGHLTAVGLSGPVNLSVVNGRLEATLDRLSDAGDVNLSAVNGPLVVTLPSDANATLRASTVHGGITNDFNLPVRVGEYVGRDLEGRIGTGGADVRLSNVNGSVNIRRAEDGRPLSPVTNLLSETKGRGDRDDDIAEAAREAGEAARDAARDAAREVRDAAREAEQEKREALTEAERERRDATRERTDKDREHQRDAARVQRDALREVERAGREIDKAMKTVDPDRLKEELNNGLRGSFDAARRTERESNTFTVSGAPRVRVETFDGAVNVHAWDKSEVMYTAVKRATDDREMQGIKLKAQAAGGEVTIRADFDKSFAHVYNDNGGHVSYTSNASAEFDLYVPRNSTLFVSTGDGRLRVDGVSGEVELRTGDGSIDVTGTRGRLRAETGDGRIRVENFDGDAEARTGDGRITLDGSFHTLAARTGDGTISLSLPEGANATVETNAESVYSDGVAVAETDAESRVRRWRIGGGGGQLLSLRTGDGQIILRRR